MARFKGGHLELAKLLRQVDSNRRWYRTTTWRWLIRGSIPARWISLVEQAAVLAGVKLTPRDWDARVLPERGVTKGRPRKDKEE